VYRHFLGFAVFDIVEFAKHFSTAESGCRMVMKSQPEIAHRFRIMIEEPNIWDQAF
jgi:hypothetical protein